jgi:phosphoribosylformylglycinamidine cyclo-ligase
MEDIVAGISEGCVQAGCALIGGEMAEHPGMMPESEYDIAGFCVGIVEKKKLITGEGIKAGDVLIGLASSGVHSNGFSLIRKIIKENDFKLTQRVDDLGESVGEVLLTPTRIYVKPALAVFESGLAKGMSHITGGGFIENIPRILPDGLTAKINRSAWQVPPIFGFIQRGGNVPEAEMFNLYNMGLGLVIAAAEKDAAKAMEILRQNGEEPVVFGEIVAGSEMVFA